MCPVCLATAAVIAGSATGTGGLTAFVAGMFFKRKNRIQFPMQSAEKEVHDDNRHDANESSEDRPAR
jgi:hypothetical protein